uniref:Uncharacterized protein n=1 Tax=Romanomermis culicivorax TaxID=13658 RepID=A0A915KVZ5_ROMCU
IEAINKLELNTLSKEDQWCIFPETGTILIRFAKEKFDLSLKKNPNIVAFAENDNSQFRLVML